MSTNDPLAVIEAETPCFARAAARDIVRRHFGIEGTLTELVSERDQNFRVRAADGASYVLKIANAKEDRLATEFQVQALLHLEGNDSAAELNTPRIVRARSGAASIVETCGDTQHVVRLVTYVSGRPLGATVPGTRLARELGHYLARLGQALREYAHAGSRQRLLWDMQHAADLRGLLHFIAAADMRELVGATLDEFEREAMPQFRKLRAQVIHADFNPDNVLVAADDDTRVAGVIDFGDMVRAPLIVDVAIGASYLRPDGGNPLALIAEFLAGYSAVTPLSPEETAILFTLIKTRIAASICIAGWRAAARGAGDPYLEKNRHAEERTEAFLVQLAGMPGDHATQAFRQVCASAMARPS